MHNIQLGAPSLARRETSFARVAVVIPLFSILFATPVFADDIVTTAKTIVQMGYAGDFEPPPSSGPKAVSGKIVWYVSCGQAYVACVQQAKGVTAAAQGLGWTLEVKDGKADPSAASGIIRSGIAAKVDGIALAGFDCPGIKSALLQAKQEHVPVVGFASLDCDDPSFGSQEKLFAATINIRGSDNAGDFFERSGAARAYYIIAKTNGQANIVSINETQQRTEQLNTAGFKRVIGQCAACKLEVSNFSFSQVPSPATQIWKGALLKNPHANVIEFGVDALMGLGLQTAIKQAGMRDAVVGGGEGFPQNFDLIREGVQTFSVAVPNEWIGWGLADTLNRFFAGASPKDLPSEGLGFQYVDKDHNLPATGAFYQPHLDYKAAYLKVWKGGAN